MLELRSVEYHSERDRGRTIYQTQGRFLKEMSKSSGNNDFPCVVPSTKCW